MQNKTERERERKRKSRHEKYWWCGIFCLCYKTGSLGAKL